MTSDALFETSDTNDFREATRLVVEHAESSIPASGIREYIAKCRTAWMRCETDDLYTLRILRHDDNKGEPYCVAVAPIHTETDAEGSIWTVPERYEQLRKPLGRTHAEIIYVYPQGGLSSESEKPEKQLLLVGLFDVLGFEAKLEALGLDAMHERYDALIQKTLVPTVAENKFSLAAGLFAGELRQGYFKLPIRYAYFSDTILLWAPYNNAFVGTFLDRCSSLFCNALDASFPVRGAVSFGEAILHKSTNTFLGAPLVEAARLEAAQDWLGVSLGVSVRKTSFPPDRILRHNPPTKQGKEALLSGIVLDWPRHWRDFYTSSAKQKLQNLRSDSFAKYYDGAMQFVDYSERNADWMLKELSAQFGYPVTQAIPR